MSNSDYNKIISTINSVSRDYTYSPDPNNLICIDTSNNRIGINTLNPQESLHISGGSIRISGDIRVNNIYANVISATVYGSTVSGSSIISTDLVNATNISATNTLDISRGRIIANYIDVSSTLDINKGRIIANNIDVSSTLDISRGNAHIRDISATNIEISGNLRVNTINERPYSAFGPTNLNFPISDLTYTKQSIIYKNPTTLTKTNISAQIDNVATIKQVYTFGQSIPDRWVAVGEGTNTIAYSSDGINWNGVTNSSTTIFTGQGCMGHGVAWNGTMWVAVGQGTNSIAYSYNGMSWIPVSGSRTNIFLNAGRGVAWSGNLWVAVGNGNNSIAYSYD